MAGARGLLMHDFHSVHWAQAPPPRSAAPLCAAPLPSPLPRHSPIPLAPRPLAQHLLNPRRISYAQDQHMYHVLVHDGISFLVMAPEALGRRVPFAFLEDACTRFFGSYGATCREVGARVCIVGIAVVVVVGLCAPNRRRLRRQRRLARRAAAAAAAPLPTLPPHPARIQNQRGRAPLPGGGVRVQHRVRPGAGAARRLLQQRPRRRHHQPRAGADQPGQGRDDRKHSKGGRRAATRRRRSLNSNSNGNSNGNSSAAAAEARQPARARQSGAARLPAVARCGPARPAALPCCTAQVLDRGEKLDLLVDKTEMLQASAAGATEPGAICGARPRWHRPYPACACAALRHALLRACACGSSGRALGPRCRPAALTLRSRRAPHRARRSPSGARPPARGGSCGGRWVQAGMPTGHPTLCAGIRQLHTDAGGAVRAVPACALRLHACAGASSSSRSRWALGVALWHACIRRHPRPPRAPPPQNVRMWFIMAGVVAVVVLMVVMMACGARDSRARCAPPPHRAPRRGSQRRCEQLGEGLPRPVRGRIAAAWGLVQTYATHARHALVAW